MDLKKILNSEFKNSSIPRWLFGLAAFIAVFFIAFKAPTDPDLFWHLKTGELIWQYHIFPYTDWYSYTMSDFGWIDHEWLAEVLMFKIKDIFGWAGLSAFFAAITAFVFIYLIPQISAKPGKKEYPLYTSYMLALLGAIVSSLVFGLRPQLFTLLGIALVFFVLKRYQTNGSPEKQNRIIYALPFIFLLWANMHASFAVGLGLLLIILALDKHLNRIAARNPKADWLELYKPFSPDQWKKAASMGLFSLGATFINPYGPRIYLEIYRTFSDGYATNVIIEWLSPNFHSPEGMLFGFYVIFVFIILAIIKKIDMLSFVLIPLFLFLAFQSARNIPLFVLITLPFLIKSMETFEDAFTEIMRKKAVLLGLSAMLIIYPPYLSNTPDVIKSFSDREKLAELGSFPEKAIEFLKNYPAFYQKNIFNDYAWGGYLIQNSKCEMRNEKIQCMPKVFIDGRMAIWKIEQQHIMKDYTEIILSREKQRETMDKYKIGIVMVEKNSFISRYLSIDPEWKQIYADNLAIIYEKAE